MDLTKSSPSIVISILCILLIGERVCRAQMFETAKPLPTSSERRVFNTGALGVKTGKPIQVIETGKEGVSKVYETGVLGVKTGKPTQVIDNKR